MIITRTPFRVSLFGGGTDYPAWYERYGGAVIGTTIDKYCYITTRVLPPFFDFKHRLVYSNIEMVDHPSEYAHPAVRAILPELGFADRGIEIHHFADLPARSGLGSSSSFSVGLINALNGIDGKATSPKYLAEQAIRIEQHVIGEKVGSQDQVWAAHGGTNYIQFNTDHSIDVQPLIMGNERRMQLNSHILLFFTGFTRIAETIAQKQIENICQRELQLKTMLQMTHEARSILQNNNSDIKDIGVMLDESWRLKRELAEDVSNAQIDSIYRAGLNAGALGGKLLGAGGGGFMMFFAAPEKHPAIRQALKELIHVKVNIGSAGSKVVVYEPSGLDCA